MAHTVIIGAGPAGLTAAYELGKLGYRATVLEADDQVGGLSRTVTYRGYRFDIGGHRFFSKVRLINELWEEILGEAFLLRPRMSRIHYNNHYFDYPLRPLNALAGLGAVEAFLVGLSYTKARLLPSRDESTFEQWVSNRFGYRLYEIFFKTYTEKVWGVPCSEISADWAAQRIKNLSLAEALRNAVFNARTSKSGEVITTLIEQFHYPQFGPGQMWERCVERVAAQGSETALQMRVERVRHHGDRIEAVYARTPDGHLHEFGGDQFISSMPIRELINAFDPPVPDDVRRAANALRYRDYLTVVLMVKREHVFPDNWIYVHSPDVKLGRIQNYKNWSPFMVPDTSRTSLGLEYFLWDHDEQWTWPTERLIELGINDCLKIGMIEREEVEDGTVVRMEKAYPVYDQEYQQHLATIRRYLEGVGNLQLVGRNGQHRYNNQDHSMLSAVFAARNLAGANYDVWSVNVEQEYHEEGAVQEIPEADRALPKPVRPVPAPAPAPMSPAELVEAAFARLDPIALGTALGMVAGLALFLATAALLVQGGVMVGRTLNLLSHYLYGYRVSWPGAFWGFAQGWLGGFALGFVVANLRNWGVAAYAYLLKRRAEAEAGRDLLDKV